MFSGSSPRVRGRRCFLNIVDHLPGLIPACAGQTGMICTVARSAAAHPRVCGADVLDMNAGVTRMGSSPRVRGRPSRRTTSTTRSGLIPACAGQTLAPAGALTAMRAHPRVCGADEVYSFNPGHDVGSSPRVRGRLGPGHLERRLVGLIPACAGQTCTFRQPMNHPRAHPRVCGADRLCDGTYADPLGSSPRVRGRPYCLRRSGRAVGLIPACAGQT